MDPRFVRQIANNNRTLCRDLTDNERVWAALLIIQEGGHVNTVQRLLKVSKETAERLVDAVTADPVPACGDAGKQEVAA